LIRPPDGENDIVGKIWKYRDTLIYDFGTIGLALLLAGLPLVLRKKITSRGRIFTITLVCIVFLDLMGYGTRFIQTYDLAPFVAKEKYVDFLKKEAAPFRVLPILDYPEQDAVLKLHKISSVNGYGSLEIRQDYQDFIAAFQTEPVTQEATILRIANYDSTAVNLLNAKYILTHNKIEDGRFPLVFSDEIPAAKTWDPYRKDKLTLYVYENRSVLPRAFIVHSAKVIAERKQILEAMKDPGFDPRRTVFLETEPKESVKPTDLDQGADDVSWVSYQEDEMILKASLAKNGYLVLSELYYPGWKAYVNGKPSQIYRSDYLFRSIFLESGASTLRLVYEPRSFKVGALVTLVTLSCLPLLLFYRRVKKPAAGTLN
jgi:hypothetical protein